MHIHVMGSGAGGGFPQWNCNCNNCKGVREGTVKASPRTQSSIAISSDGIDWILFNASPDIKKQMDDFPALQPAREVRDTAIKAILITDAQIDHVTGLLTLREHNKPWDIYHPGSTGPYIYRCAIKKRSTTVFTSSPQYGAR